VKPQLQVIQGGHYNPRAEGAACDLCPLRKNKPVPPAPPESGNVRLVIVGEGPGQHEERLGVPFVGVSGVFLNRKLEEASPEDDLRRDAWVTNATLCHPDGENDEKAAAVCCAPRLYRELAQLPADVPILALGASAARSLLNVKSILLARGFVWTAKEIDESAITALKNKAHKTGLAVDRLKHRILRGRAKLAGRKVFPTIHPAFVLRLDSWHPVLKVDVDRFARFLRGEIAEPLEDEGPYKVYRTPDKVERALAKLRRDVVAVDIETDGIDPLTARILCVGVNDGYDGVVIRWDDDENKNSLIPELARVLSEFLATRQVVVFHNGKNFDEIALERDGVVFIDNVQDTLLALHSFSSHLPKRLDWLASIYSDANPWKVKFGRRGAEEKGLAPHHMPKKDLWLYNNCLTGRTPVRLADGSTLSLDTIVNRQLSVEVLSMSPKGEIEARRVIGWSKSRVADQHWIGIRTNASDKYQKLVVTPEHKIYTKRGQITASEIVVGDMIPIAERRWSKEQRQAILGTLLGDSSLAASPTLRGRFMHTKTLYLTGSHKETQGLAQAKVEISGGLLEFGRIYVSRGFGKPVSMQCFSSPSSVQLKRLRHLLFDRRGRRRLTVAALERLGAIGLAWWFMDDGCRQNGQTVVRKKGTVKYPDTITIAACRYPREDVDAAREWFQHQLGGRVYAAKDKVLRFNREATDAICDVIAPYIFPCVRYKLPHDRPWPEYVARRLNISHRPVHARVVEVGSHEPRRDNRAFRYQAETRFCLTVEENNNFFTHVGLVHNSDARLTARGWRGCQGDLAKERHIYEHDKQLAQITKEMQVYGVPVDRERRDELSLAMKERARELKWAMREMTGRFTFKPGRHADVRWALFEKFGAPVLNLTGTGLPSTSNATLESLRGTGTEASQFADLMAEYRAVTKVKSTYVDSVALDDEDFAHFNWRVFGTVSGRWSCRIQSCPRWSAKIEDRPREMYCAKPGWEFVYFDLSQSEMRAAAYLAGDDAFIATCETGDVHTGNAKILFPKGIEALTRDPKGKNCPQHKEGGDKRLECDCGKLMRDIAKNSGFGVLYSAEVATIFTFLRNKGFDVTSNSVQAMFDLVKDTYSRYYDYCEENLAFCKKNGWQRTAILKRKRQIGYFPKPGDVYNFKVQSLIADLMNLRLLELKPRLPKKAHVVTQVHDALMIHVPKGRQSELVKREVKEIWAQPVHIEESGRTMVMPIDLKEGERWSSFG
jgi:uracil-DNA glycosylase family 4